MLPPPPPPPPPFIMPKGSSVHCDIPCNKTQILHKLYKIKYTKVKHTKYLCFPHPLYNAQRLICPL